MLLPIIFSLLKCVFCAIFGFFGLWEQVIQFLGVIVIAPEAQTSRKRKRNEQIVRKRLPYQQFHPDNFTALRVLCNMRGRKSRLFWGILWSSAGAGD